MSFDAETASIPLTCPACAMHNKQGITIKQLEREMAFSCPGCQQRILVDKNRLKTLKKSLQSVEKAIERFNGSLTV